MCCCLVFFLTFFELKCFPSRIVDIWTLVAVAGSTVQNVRHRMEEYMLPGTPKPLRFQYLKYATSTFLQWKCLLFLCYSPTATWIVCTAKADAVNRTAPPPMIPKLLTVMENYNLVRSRIINIWKKDNSPPGQSFLQVANGPIVDPGELQFPLGSMSSWHPGPPCSNV